ncbi:MAG TPA: threonine--tRNA ligase, partial [Ruminococcaceae bacterium]|nr:threonine--tRNA ligase [Oscillospiraceae bacterium]
TIQIDMLLAEKFGMYYIDSDGQKKLPYIIHRTSLGCFERTLAYMLERFAGALPLWLSPEQVRILPISETLADKAKEIEALLTAAGIRTTVDLRSEKIGYKIREAQLDKIPYMLVIGQKEAENGTVSVRSRKQVDMGAMSVEDFLTLALKEIAAKQK